jgi:hypothetical protein
MSFVVASILAGFGLSGWSDDLLKKAAELLFDDAGKYLLEETQARLRAYAGDIPANHDLEHAIRYAELTSTLVLLEEYRRQDEGDRFDVRGAMETHGQLDLCAIRSPALAVLKSKFLTITSVQAAHKVRRAAIPGRE